MRGVCGEEVGVKCGCMQGCCEDARSGVRSWRRMVQVAVSTKTNRVGAAARQSKISPPRAHLSRGEPPPNWSCAGREDTGDVWSQGSRGGYGEEEW